MRRLNITILESIKRKMDLFFECVKQKPADETMTMDEAMDFLCRTPMLLAVLDLYVNDNVMVKIAFDSRGAGVYQFKTIMGPHVVAEALYRPMRARLENCVTFDGPPATPLGHYVPSKDKIRVSINALNKNVEDDEDDEDDVDLT
jgi:hypothetical protein